MSNLLFPRLSPAIVAAIHAELNEVGSVIELAQRSDTSHPMQTFGQTGGNRITEAQLQNIKAAVEKCARAHGYPNRRGATFADFDNECALFIHEAGPGGGEALRDDVWSFWGSVLFPHIVKWRFNNFGSERIRGGVRNTFQRLWLRARAFDRGEGHEKRWGVMLALIEDSHVAILERPGLSANPRLALAMGESWLKASASNASGMQDITRRAVKHIRAIYPVISLDTLNEEQLCELVDNVFDSSLPNSDNAIPER